jgi:hypothetical protein
MSSIQIFSCGPFKSAQERLHVLTLHADTFVHSVGETHLEFRKTVALRIHRLGSSASHTGT